MSAQAGIIEHVFDKNMCLMGGRVGHERHTYVCIDLKTFYASVECVDRGLNPLTTNLVVADESRGRTTICLAITQAMRTSESITAVACSRFPTASTTSRPYRACSTTWRCQRKSTVSIWNT